ncbi:MAG TPA: hypothetical protein VF316_23750 [Polyangiaceae bacterium]
MRLLLPFVLAALVAGCVPLTVGPSSPRPNVMVAADKTASKQVLGPLVQSEFVVPGNGSVDEVTVTGWRQTLDTGFRNAWPTSRPNGRTLEILDTELSFAPAAVTVRGGAVAVRAQIRYKARLLDGTGQEIGVAAGTVEAREATGSVNGMTDNAAKAVESLYEKLSTDLLAK